MAVLLDIGIIAYISVFFGSVFFSAKFQFGEESKDERGKNILNTSYTIAFPIFILGWFIIYLIDEFITPFSFESYKMAIWFILTGAYIVHAVSLFNLKRVS
ncbi:hypothetical protein ACIQGW_20475 [Lysinibacillus xylanilyticus]|uniref:hypothetical protein n=1 Tax=Lysinibacillus xylanilyticus TaxID=582475 RepID=UPI003811A72C